MRAHLAWQAHIDLKRHVVSYTLSVMYGFFYVF